MRTVPFGLRCRGRCDDVEHVRQPVAGYGISACASPFQDALYRSDVPMASPLLLSASFYSDQCSSGQGPRSQVHRRTFDARCTHSSRWSFGAVVAIVGKSPEPGAPQQLRCRTNTRRNGAVVRRPFVAGDRHRSLRPCPLDRGRPWPVEVAHHHIARSHRARAVADQRATLMLARRARTQPHIQPRRICRPIARRSKERVASRWGR